MRSRADRLKKIFEISRADERRACREMGSAQKALDSEVTRLHELESYRRSYAKQFESRESFSSARWQDYQSFLQRIDSAVDSQREIIMIGKRTRDVHRHRWLTRKRKLDSLEQAVGRFQRIEDRASDRRTQKALDEITASGRFSRIRIPD